MSLFDHLPAFAETHIETSPPDPREEKLKAMVAKIQDRYGSDAIKRLGK